ADLGLFQLYPLDNAAVAIVLDCSGSMFWPVGGKGAKGDGRWKLAREALARVLEQLPAGVWVSVRVFGAEGLREPRKDAGGIELVWKPRQWRKEHLGPLMETLKGLKPNGATPLVRSMLMARGDFPPNFKGERTMVVVTDGGDSNFYETVWNVDTDLKKENTLP